MGIVIAFIAAIIAGPAMLLLWSLIYPAACWSLAVPLFITLILTLAIREGALRRRRCLADCWFATGSPLHRLFSSPVIVTLIAAVIATMLTAVLMITIVSWDFEILALLALDSLVITVVYLGFYRTAAGTLKINPGFRTLFARNWSVAINVPLMVVALFFWQLQQPPPDYLDSSLRLEPSIQAASDSVTSSCPLVDSMLRLGRESEAVSWWLALKATRAIEDNQLRWVAWILFLVSGTLILWAYSRFCVQLVYYAHRGAGD